MRASITRNTPRSSEPETEVDFASDVSSASGVDEHNGNKRVVISRLEPTVDGGDFAIKRIIGDQVKIVAHIFADGHDLLSAVVKYRHASETRWMEEPLVEKPNDVWVGSFLVSRLGTYFYTVEAWVDEFGTWSRNLAKKFEAGTDVGSELIEGAALISQVRAEDHFLEKASVELGSNFSSQREKVELAKNAEVVKRMAQRSHRRYATLFDRELKITVEPPLARFGAWYELFPRSCSPTGDRHGTFKDCARWLPRISDMGFDVVYLPPIHPIGISFRKGRNGNLQAGPDEPGSPWAIGSSDGGHKSLHPRLGTMEEFHELIQTAKALSLEIALDIAFQCSPDHPWVAQHPEWFRHRPDGSIQFAENPPKKYQDIYPFNFETENWEGLWTELKSIFEFWIEQGIRVFRVDNPHTKPFAFWEWCIRSLKERRPDLIFLSEAFTRPKIMYHLAKVGFTQSYNYFPWRNTKKELEELFGEMAKSGAREFFRPNLWPNTPDILTERLQHGGRPVFMIRAILAATLGASYGIYGPPFEFCENRAREANSEEYLNSEKYEIRSWDFGPGAPLTDLLTRLNKIRRENSALQSDDTLRFQLTDNEELVAYSKQVGEGEQVVVTVVNLDPDNTQSGWVRLSIEDWGMNPGEPYQCHDLLTGTRYLWTGPRNYVELNPHSLPAHIFRVYQQART